MRLRKVKLQKTLEYINENIDNYRKNMVFNKQERMNIYGVAEDALLTVVVCEAKDLKPLDYTGKSDPYVVIQLDKEKSTSTFKPQTLNPVWNESFGL